MWVGVDPPLSRTLVRGGVVACPSWTIERLVEIRIMERRRECMERYRERKQTGFSTIRVETLMGGGTPQNWDARHLAEYAEPYRLTDPESHDLMRLYPGPRHHEPLPGDRRPYPGLAESPPRIEYKNEAGLYPLSCVQRLPDVDPARRETIEPRRVMERKALFETIITKSWRTRESPGRSMRSPDDYPWPQMEDELFDCTNNDPHNGPVSRDVWHVYWNRQTELFCDFPPPQEVEEAGLYRCYVCRAMPTRENQVTLKRCLICRDVYMCRDHWRRLACLDSFAVVCCRHSRFTPSSGWNPYGGFPMLDGFPKDVPKQERWQDIDNISVNYGITYCP
eukprot:747509-Amphidinium_carterae.1